MTAPIVKALEVLAAQAAAEVSPLWELPASAIPAALMDTLPAVVDKWALAGATIAADWYDDERDHAEIAGRFSAIVDELPDLGAYSLAGWAVEPVHLDVPDLTAVRYRVEGGLQKRIANAANLTITGSATADPAARGWMRTTRPGACDFCLMVAGRGGVFTRATATFACHENCYCRAVPAWGGRELPVKPYRRSLRRRDQARADRWIAENLEGKKQPAESQADAARRLLPGLEQSLKDLRAKGLDEDSPQIEYHVAQIARLRRQLNR